MTSLLSKMNPDGTAVTRRGAGATRAFPTSPRPMIAVSPPFPESACPSPLYEEVTIPQAGLRSSWKAMLGRLVYVAVASIAMFGWLYLLWLVLVSSAQAILS